MKVALLQCNMTSGDIVGNMKRIIQAARRAHAVDASLCVTSELALCGISPKDILFSDGFMDGCYAALQSIANELKNGPALLMGMPMLNAPSSAKMLTNAAILIQNGKFSLVSSKVFSPYPEGDHHYFEHGVSCGLVTVAGWRLGVVICEHGPMEYSFWNTQKSAAHNQLMELVSRGIDGIIHLALHPHALGEQKQREHMLSHVAARHHIHLFSANLVGGNGSKIYAGQSVAFDPTGNLLARGRAFEEDLLIVDTAVGKDSIAKLLPSTEEECWHSLVLGTRDYVHKTGNEGVVIGISGGIDSAMVAAIAVEALGKHNVEGVVLPSPYTSEESLQYAAGLCKNLGIKSHNIAINSIMDACNNALEPIFADIVADPNDVSAENLQARIRANLLMAIANRKGYLVLNTGNKSESAMGYSTLYGDSTGALSVIGDVPKTLLYTMAHWYNKEFSNKIIPKEIIARAPTAELRPNQLDSQSLPPYDELDPMIEHIIGANQLDDELNNDKLQHVFSSMCKAEFKRRQSAPALQVSGYTLGTTWRTPLVSKVRLPKVKNIDKNE